MDTYTLTITLEGIAADTPREAALDAVRMLSKMALYGQAIFVDATDEGTGSVTRDIQVVLGKED